MYDSGKEIEPQVPNLFQVENMFATGKKYIDFFFSSDDDLKQIAKEICSSLKSMQQYSAAATIYLQFLSDTEQAVKSYILGKMWTDAVYAAETHGHPHFIGN